MQEFNRARHPVDKSSVRWWDVEMVEGWGELLQARGATCVASPAVERGERFGGWLQASILGFSQSCEERDSLGSKARFDRAGHPSRRTVPFSGQAPPVYPFHRVNQKKKKKRKERTVWNETWEKCWRRWSEGRIVGRSNDTRDNRGERGGWVPAA